MCPLLNYKASLQLDSEGVGKSTSAKFIPGYLPQPLHTNTFLPYAALIGSESTEGCPWRGGGPSPGDTATRVKHQSESV